MNDERIDDYGRGRLEQPNEKRKTVTVNCAHPNGLQLKLHREHHHEKSMGPKIPDPEKGIVTLAPGLNEGVDKAFVDAWLEENKGSDLVKNGTISVVDEQKQHAGGKPGEDHIVDKPDNESSIDAPAPKADDKAEVTSA